MLSVWKLTQSLAVSGVFLGSLFQGVNLTVAAPQVAQTTSQESSTRKLDRRTNFSFESRGCTRKRTRVMCEAVVTNFGNIHRTVRFGASYKDYQTRVIDPTGNVFVARSVQFNNVQRGRDRITTDLAPGIPTKLVYSFRIPEEVTEISAIDIGYLAINRIDVLSRTTLSNIGTISTTTANNQ